MSIEVKVPAFPESVADGSIISWHKNPGDVVTRDEILVEIETDKVVFEVPAPQDGVLGEVLVGEGATVLSGQVLTHIETSDKNAKSSSSDLPAQSAVKAGKTKTPAIKSDDVSRGDEIITPSAGKMIAERGLDASKIEGSGKGGRVLKEDVLRYLGEIEANSEPAAAIAAHESTGVQPKEDVFTEMPHHVTDTGRPEKRVPMTRLRSRIAERLLEAQHNAAILTTFNEVNMQPVMDIRSRYRESFEKEYGVKLGFMSFFVKAVVEALKHIPDVNASIDGNDIVYHGFYDIGIAVSSPRGLVVPVLRDADRLSMAGIEGQIAKLSEKAKNKSLSIEEITGGTFTITNGGVFGSLLSTPILNPPQSAILGMHKIQQRPMVENGEIVILPMMYIALSYDHRIIDGKEAVQCLVSIKEALEDPARLLLEV